MTAPSSPSLLSALSHSADGAVMVSVAATRQFRHVISVAIWILAALVATPLVACGPFFPNMLLVGGDDPVLAAPVATFRAQMDRLNLAAPEFKARLSTNGPRQQSMDADIADLRAALSQDGMNPTQITAIVEPYEAARRVLLRHAEAVEAWEGSTSLAAPIPPPQLIPPADVAGLPAEFADYLRGAVAWHSGRTNDARAAWQSLLKRPLSERRFKSTWATFMLGRSYDETDSARAIRHYRQVRDLAKAGFHDSAGLAVASVGWEARLEYSERRYEKAILLYLDQLAAGDESAYISLRWVAGSALRDRHAPLRRLASNPHCRRVITAWLISGGNYEGLFDMDSPAKEATLNLLAKAPIVGARARDWHSMEHPGLLWLEAVERANVTGVEAAEEFAVAAYQAGDMAIARRWVDRAGTSPVARWIDAKLLLRDGKLEAAAARLAQVCRSFPMDSVQTNATDGATFGETLLVDDQTARDHDGTASARLNGESIYRVDGAPMGRQALGELGVLQLARREYSEALVCLLRAGFWIDAAYVAERVLTIEELKRCVDQRWPASSVAAVPEPATRFRALSPAEQIRHLLGRRLARSGRGHEAREYFPQAFRDSLDTLNAGVAARRNSALPPAQRAALLWAAAEVARHEGMQLLGTEVEPDWACHGGSFAHGPTVVDREGQTNAVTGARSEEIRRGAAHAPDPDDRFHYRYVAASLGWDAAALLPNNSDETARMLCVAGSWLKNMDPKAADKFYKALVRRCRETAIGRAADARRWFPILDERGNLLDPRQAAASVAR